MGISATAAMTSFDGRSPSDERSNSGAIAVGLSQSMMYVLHKKSKKALNFRIDTGKG
jgi:hypothetical protein